MISHGRNRRSSSLISLLGVGVCWGWLHSTPAMAMSCNMPTASASFIGTTFYITQAHHAQYDLINSEWKQATEDDDITCTSATKPDALEIASAKITNQAVTNTIVSIEGQQYYVYPTNNSHIGFILSLKLDRELARYHDEYIAIGPNNLNNDLVKVNQLLASLGGLIKYHIHFYYRLIWLDNQATANSVTVKPKFRPKSNFFVAQFTQLPLLNKQKIEQKWVSSVADKVIFDVPTRNFSTNNGPADDSFDLGPISTALAPDSIEGKFQSIQLLISSCMNVQNLEITFGTSDQAKPNQTDAFKVVDADHGDLNVDALGLKLKHETDFLSPGAQLPVPLSADGSPTQLSFTAYFYRFNSQPIQGGIDVKSTVTLRVEYN